LEKSILATSYRDQFEIRQGRVKLYRRTAQGTNYESDSWYAAFKIPGHPTLRRSLKTNDKYEAETLAESHFYNLVQKAERGMSLTSKKFSLVAESFFDDFKKNVIRESSLPRHEQRYKPERLKNIEIIIRKYFIPYFKDKSIQEITDFDIESYKEWRRVYWTSGEGSTTKIIQYLRNGHKVKRPKRQAEKAVPNYGTLNKELTVLRHIFEFARLSRIIEGREIPIIKNVPRPRNFTGRKPGLTEEEIKHLLNTTVLRYRNETNPKHKCHLKLLIHYIAFMCLTGMRVAEANQLKLSDCQLFHKGNEQYLKLFVRAKGKSRELIGLDESPTTLEKLKAFHRENAEKNGWQCEPDMYVFVDQYGRHVKSFTSGLERALSDATLLHDKHGVKRSAGAFRKYYITSALLSEVNYFQLAKQCGTSVGVIEKYYAEIETHQTPEKFMFKNALTGVYDET